MGFTPQTAAGERRRTSRPPGVMARPLNPDLPAWEKQDAETQAAYDAFLQYRDSEHRRLRDVQGRSQGVVREWSATWQWAFRCLEWDRYCARVDAEDMVRYRVEMNERHRRLARTVQEKVAAYLKDLDLTWMTPRDAGRWLDIACRLERQASGADLVDAFTPGGVAEDFDSALTGLTLADVLGQPVMLDQEEAAMAEQIWRQMPAAAE